MQKTPAHNPAYDRFINDALKNIEAEYQPQEWREVEQLIQAMPPSMPAPKPKSLLLAAGVLAVAVGGFFIIRSLSSGGASGPEENIPAAATATTVLTPAVPQLQKAEPPARDTAAVLVKTDSVPPVNIPVTTASVVPSTPAGVARTLTDSSSQSSKTAQKPPKKKTRLSQIAPVISTAEDAPETIVPVETLPEPPPEEIKSVVHTDTTKKSSSAPEKKSSKSKKGKVPKSPSPEPLKEEPKPAVVPELKTDSVN